MKMRLRESNPAEEIRTSIAAMCLIFAFVSRSEGAATLGLILFGFSCGFGFLVWFSCLKKYRVIEGTPTSSIASAAQGYVKLSGYMQAFPGRILKAPISGTDCVWYRCLVPEVNKRRIENGDSDAPFLLVDAKGQCIIEPAGADVFTLRHTEWREPYSTLLRSRSATQKTDAGEQLPLVPVDPDQISSGNRSHHYEEWLLLPGDPLVALGYFISGQVTPEEAHIKEDISQRLADWKDDMQARFDLNGDKQVDGQEWQLARSAARREVLKEHVASQTDGQQHRLVQPPDGRPFLLGTLRMRWLAARYLLLALFNLAVFLTALWSVSTSEQLLSWL